MGWRQNSMGGGGMGDIAESQVQRGFRGKLNPGKNRVILEKTPVNTRTIATQ